MNTGVWISPNEVDLPFEEPEEAAARFAELDAQAECAPTWRLKPRWGLEDGSEARSEGNTAGFEPPGLQLDVPRAVDQGEVPCCMAAAFARCLESRLIVRGFGRIDLSHQFINYWARPEGDFGRPLNVSDVIDSAILMHGLAAAAFDPPAEINWDRVPPSPEAIADASQRRVTNRRAAPFSQVRDRKQETFKGYLAHGEPLVLIFHQTDTYLRAQPGNQAARLLELGNHEGNLQHAVCAYNYDIRGLLVCDSFPGNFVSGAYWCMSWEFVQNRSFTLSIIRVTTEFA